jgi:hypothetical protein
LRAAQGIGLARSFSVHDILATLEAEILLDDGWLRDGITTICASDLHSDILSHSVPKSILLTGLTNPQAIRSAEMAEIAAVCFIHGKIPHEETIELARHNQMPLLITPLSMYNACGKLFAAGLADRDVIV